jgi:hypothetical protein
MAGRTVMTAPQARSAEFDCGTYTIRPEGLFSDGFVVYYYVIPLAFSTGASKTESFLELPITTHIKTDPVFDLTLDDVQIQVPGIDKRISPSRIEVISDSSFYVGYRKTFRLTFEVDRHKLRNFTLVFSKPLHGCTIPDTPYLVEEQKHYISPINQ